LSNIFVTGGAGFIGSNLVLRMVRDEGLRVINIDKLTYAANPQNLQSLRDDPRHVFQQIDINDAARLQELFAHYEPTAVVHLAAESHVDRSILGPAEFVETNIKGTFTLVEESRRYWNGLTGDAKKAFRVLHVSTDEVYGSLGEKDAAFTEQSPYRPNSPYAASKAASDHLVRAYFHTYGFPALITNCSNNYGPYQFPEKLIPLTILNALSGKAIPIYGDGKNVRDWLYVEDHCEALSVVLKQGRPGQTYNIGGNNERSNLETVHAICALLDESRPATQAHAKLIQFVTDRPGHDRRYAVDALKINRELGWKPRHSAAEGLRKTVDWYLQHEDWINAVQTGAYKKWIEQQYSSRTI
jgi:dTDP-glucose 4,6-dehydratase